jgi:20S proteasome subunit alpha 7
LRPFGCSALLASYDDANGPQLYGIEPVGTGYRFFATAIGKQKGGICTELEKIDFKTVTCREAVNLIAKM